MYPCLFDQIAQEGQGKGQEIANVSTSQLVLFLHLHLLCLRQDLAAAYTGGPLSNPCCRLHNQSTLFQGFHRMDDWLLHFHPSARDGRLQVSVYAVWLDPRHSPHDCRFGLVNGKQHVRWHGK